MTTIGQLDKHDVRDVLAMRSPLAVVLATAFVATQLTMALWNDQGIRNIWITALAAVISGAAVAGVMYLPGEPLPARWGALLALSSPVVAALAVSQLPVPLYNTEQRWFFTATAAYLPFMCVRGATMWAWVGLFARFLVYSAWTAASGLGFLTGLAQSSIDAAPLLMATFFAYTVRPTAQSIFSLRDRAARNAATKAAHVAAQNERDAQLDRLDTVARPMLDAIAGGRALTLDEQEECRLLEAQLRDRLRAGLLIDDAVAVAAAAARRRGVSVVLLDDSGRGKISQTVLQAVRTATESTLALTRSGRVSARVLPPGRPLAATILVVDGDDEYHIDIGTDGVVASDRADKS